MNQHNDQQNPRDVDLQVSDQYAALADEKTPEELDQLVLREAARAVRADNRKGSFEAWFRPVAFMATVGLSLAIILDFSDTSIFGLVSDTSREITGSAADTAGRAPGQSSLNEIKRQEKSAPDERLMTDAPDSGGDDVSVAQPAGSLRPDSGQARKLRPEFSPADTLPQAAPSADHARISDAVAVEAESIEQRVQKAEAAIDANRQSQTSAAVQLAAPQAMSGTESNALQPLTSCRDAQKSDPRQWWQCIAALRQSGLAETADEELLKFREAFPDYAPPE